MRKAWIAAAWLALTVSGAPARPSDDPPEEPPQVRAVRIGGNAAFDDPALVGRVPLQPGRPLRLEELQLSAGILESTYRNSGFYEAAVSTAVLRLPAGQADVVFEVREGPLYRFGNIAVEGNRLISDDIIRRTMEIKPGDLFSQSRIFDSDRRLYTTGYFDAVDFAYSTTTAHTVNLRIVVRERATRFIKGGIGYGTQTKERVTLGFEDKNFLGNARRLDVSGTYSAFLTQPDKYRTALLQANLIQPYFLGTPLEGQTSVSREWANRESYDSISTAWRSNLGRRFGSAITASLRYRYSGTRLTRVSPDARTPGFTNISAVGPTFTYDNTNDPFLPSNGWRVIGTYEEGLRAFLGDVRFHKFESRVGRYDTLRRWTLFEGLQFGHIMPGSRSSQDVIPIFERYFIGGANTVRGYNERELGPRDPTGAPLGGNAFLVGNLELRHALYRRVFGVLFLDAGQLYVTPAGRLWPFIQMEEWGDLLYSTGGGLRLHSPIGSRARFRRSIAT